MKAAIAFLAVATLASCAKESAREEERYQMIGAAGSPRDRCTQARKVSDAYLKEGNKQRYHEWALRADLNCGM